MEINRRDFITKVSAIAALSVLPSSFVAAMGNEKVEKAKPKYPTLKCDVVVVGAGPGGVPAAIAAARQGAKVILLEEDNMPGGAPVDMYVPFICGGPRVGVFQEMIQVLNAKHTIGGRTCETFGKTGSDGKNHWWMPGSYAEVIYQLLEKEENITLMCAAPVVGVKLKTSGNRNQVTGVRIMRNGDYQDIDAAVTIDATGNGLIADMAGCEYMFGSEAKSDYNEPVGIEVADGKVQPCTWMLIYVTLPFTI